MIGFYGAVGQGMCLELDSLAVAEIDRPAALAFTSDDPGNPNSSVRIYCNAPQSHSDSGSALAIYGHVISPELVGYDHARQLLAAIDSGGLESMKDLDGFHSLVYVNGATRELTLLRDQWGANTIYYVSDDRGLAFSTSVLQLVPLLEQPIRANLISAERFLVHGSSPLDGQTHFAAISQVLPRTKLTIHFSDSIQLLTKDFHTLLAVDQRANDISFDEAAEHARMLFLKSIGNVLLHTETAGFTLSGGVDSSGMVMGAKLVAPERSLQTYSYVTNARAAIDEERYVDRINLDSGANGNKLRMDADAYFSNLPVAVRQSGAPLAGTSQLAQLLLYQTASSQGVDTMINGVEADSAFCGHVYFLVDRFLELWSQHAYAQAFTFAMGVAKTSQMSQYKAITLEILRRMPKVFSRRILTRIQPTRDTGWLGFVAPKEGASASFPTPAYRKDRRVQSHMYIQLSTDRHLRYADLSGSGFSVNSRTPYLSREMNQFVFSLPSHYLLTPDGNTKKLLRQVLQGIVPDVILDRTDKIGFEAPTKDWLLSEPAKVESYLNEGVEMGVLSPRHGLWKKQNYASIDRAISYIEWARTFSVHMG